MSLYNTFIQREIQPGTYRTKIHYHKECKPVERNGRPSNKQPFIKVQMNIDGIEVTDRWYASRIPYIMRCIRHQFRADYMDYTLSQLIKLATEHEITVNISYDGFYGMQIDYAED